MAKTIVQAMGRILLGLSSGYLMKGHKHFRPMPITTTTVVSKVRTAQHGFVRRAELIQRPATQPVPSRLRPTIMAWPLGQSSRRMISGAPLAILRLQRTRPRKGSSPLIRQARASSQTRRVNPLLTIIMTPTEGTFAVLYTKKSVFGPLTSC